MVSETPQAEDSPRGGRQPLRRFTFLDLPSTTYRWKAPESLTLVLYLGVVGFGIAQHVPWADEAQAWMLAQAVSLPTLLIHSLHYEGTPGLWHCLLKLLQALHLSFTATRWVAGTIAASGIVVLLAFAPFPRIVRLLLPFSFFLAYQDAVIARSYVLFAVLAFVAAALLRSARPRPLLAALVLGLMANISLHALLASGALAVVAAVVAFRRWRSLPSRRRLLLAVLLFAAFWIGAAATMAPAPDVDFSAGNNVWRGITKLENQLGIHAVGPPVLSSLGMANLPRAPLPVHLRHGTEKMWNKLARTLSVITYPLSSNRWLALLLVGLVVAQAFLRPGEKSRQPRAPLGPLGLLPYLVMVVVFTSLYLEPRHTGMVFTSFVVAAWLTWPEFDPDSQALHGRVLLGRVTAAVFTLVLVIQITWTARAMTSEHTLAYSPEKVTAAYLQQNGAGSEKPAAGFYYYSVGPLLYFDRNIYSNQPPHRYWSWSTEMRSYATVEQVLARHPAFLVIGGYQPGPDAEITRDWLPNPPAEPGVRLGDAFFVGDYFRHHGYHDTQIFCGHSWMRSSYAEQECESILEPNAVEVRSRPDGIETVPAESRGRVH